MLLRRFSTMRLFCCLLLTTPVILTLIFTTSSWIRGLFGRSTAAETIIALCDRISKQDHESNISSLVHKTNGYLERKEGQGKNTTKPKDAGAEDTHVDWDIRPETMTSISKQDHESKISSLVHKTNGYLEQKEGQGNNTTKPKDAGAEDTHVDWDIRPETVTSIQERRQRVLSDGCREFARIVNKSRPAWYEMYYDDRMHYIYCLISKVACTSWKRTLMMLTGNITEFRRPEQLKWGMVHNHRNSDKYVARLETLSEANRNWRFSRYFTFLFVREPLERLVSAYRDKLIEDRSYHVDVSIVRQYRPRDYRASVKRYNVTFAEFVRYVLEQRAAGRVLDRHWIPQNELCRVCQRRYDFVGHHETLHRDAAYVVAELKSRIRDAAQRLRVATVKFPADSGHRKSSKFMQQMYASVPAEHIQALYQLYSIDYALFGFKHPIATGFRHT